MAQVALDEKFTFGYYKLPVVVDSGRYHTGSEAPVIGVWCPRLNDRSSILRCSSCAQFGGLARDAGLTHTFVRCRCSNSEDAFAASAPAEPGSMARARTLKLDDAKRR